MKLTFSLLALCASTAALLVATGKTMPSQPQEPVRSPEELCGEVRAELLIHVAEFPGSMTVKEANHIADKCLRIHSEL